MTYKERYEPRKRYEGRLAGIRRGLLVISIYIEIILLFLTISNHPVLFGMILMLLLIEIGIFADLELNDD